MLYRKTRENKREKSDGYRKKLTGDQTERLKKKKDR